MDREVTDITARGVEARLAAIGRQVPATGVDVDEGGMARIEAALNQRRRSGNIAHSGVDDDVVAKPTDIPGAQDKGCVGVRSAGEQHRRGECRSGYPQWQFQRQPHMNPDHLAPAKRIGR